MEAQISARRSLPEGDWPNDALSRFLTTEIDGERLSDRAVTTQVMFSIGAGSDTTRNVLGSLLYRLAVDPELYARIRVDRDLIDLAVEEALRLDPPAQFLVRRCLVDEFDLGGEPLTSGDIVMLSIGGGNRDDAVFPEPDRFDLDRPNLRDHLGFGVGPHICPGTALARLELRLALSAWCDAVETFELADGFVWQGPAHGDAARAGRAAPRPDSRRVGGACPAGAASAGGKCRTACGPGDDHAHGTAAPAGPQGGIRSPREAIGDSSDQRIASGLTGEPTAPVTGSGAATSRNSHRCSPAQARASVSRSNSSPKMMPASRWQIM